MLEIPQIVNDKDSVVVSFHNATDFDFTPEMGCMFDGRPITGKTGFPGIAKGETVILPYSVGMLLARNLAKRVLNTSPQATADEKGNPVGKAVWTYEGKELESFASKYIKELYAEERPIPQTETDRLMAKVDEYKSMVDKLLAKEASTTEAPTTPSAGHRDKSEVIAELEKRGIQHDKRKSKEQLESLLV